MDTVKIQGQIYTIIKNHGCVEIDGLASVSFNEVTNGSNGWRADNAEYDRVEKLAVNKAIEYARKAVKNKDWDR